MSSSTKKLHARPSPAEPKPALRWQGFLGPLKGRPWTALVVVVLCLAAIIGAAILVLYPQAKAGYHWQQAQRAATAFEFRAAQQHLEKCLAVWPSSGETWFTLARVCRRDGNFPAAREHLQQAKRYEWSTEAIDLEYKLIQAQQGQVRAVEHLLIGYLEAGHADKMVILEAMVDGYRKHNFLDDAYRWASVWVDDYPEMWQPRLLRAQILEQGQKPLMAAQEYQDVLHIAPDQLAARLQLALIFLRGKQYPEAREQFEQYLKKRPTDTQALVGMARCQRAMQQAESAAKTVEQVIVREPENAEACLVRGLIAWDMERPDESLTWLRRAEKIAPFELETNQYLGVVLRELGKPEEAEKYEARRSDVEERYRKLEVLIKELLTVERGMDRSFKAEPDLVARRRCVDLRVEIGTNLLAMDQERDGVGWILSALQEDPGNPQARQVIQDYQRRLQERESKEAGAAGKPR